MMHRRRLLQGIAGLVLCSRQAQARTGSARLLQQRLSNGLNVVVFQEPRAAYSAVHVWYRVGGRDDVQGATGLAHLLEHLMFKRTAQLAPDQLSRMVDAAGGQSNAFTEADVTAYHCEVPPGLLGRILWAEADRMRGLVLDKATFDTERRVVLEELYSNEQTEPLGQLWSALNSQLFEGHPYGQPVIGTVADLQSLDVADAEELHRRFYGPASATVVVVGPTPVDEVRGLVRRHFATLPRRGEPKLPPSLASLRSQLGAIRSPRIARPVAGWAFRGPAACTSMSAAFQVLACVLVEGAGSRIRNQLTKTMPGAEVQCKLEQRELAATLMLAIQAPDGVPVKDLDRLVAFEVEDLLRRGPRDAEVKQAQHQLERQWLVDSQLPQARALALGWSNAFTASSHAALGYANALRQVTPTHVRDAATQVLRSSVRINYLPA